MTPGAFILRIAAFIHTLLILALVPLGRPLQRLVEEAVARSGAAEGVLDSAGAAVALALLCLYFFILLRSGRLRPFLKVLPAILIISILLCLRGFSAWVEAAHIPIFALLAILIFSGWDQRGVATVVAASAIGLLDEVLQGMHPQRVFDLYDIWLNFLSSSLGLLIALPFSTRSRRIASSLCASSSHKRL